MQDIEKKFHSMATVSMIEQLQTVDKDLKHKFNTEFEQFQQYLKEQSTKFSEIRTKFREMEKKMSILDKIP